MLVGLNDGDCFSMIMHNAVRVAAKIIFPTKLFFLFESG